ncbi:hypothetical protein Dimus_020723 [Dionaea muscipula]
MVRSYEKSSDLCDRPYHGATCPVMKFIEEQIFQFSSRETRKRRDSSGTRGPMRQDHATSSVYERRAGRLFFLDKRSEKAPDSRSTKALDRKSDILDRRFEKAIDRCFDDSLLDRRSEKAMDRRSVDSPPRRETKDKSHSQCYVCDQYGHYSTQCDLNPKAKKQFHSGDHNTRGPTTKESGREDIPTTTLGVVMWRVLCVFCASSNVDRHQQNEDQAAATWARAHGELLVSPGTRQGVDKRPTGQVPVRRLLASGQVRRPL